MTHVFRSSGLRGWIFTFGLLLAGMSISLTSCSPKCDPDAITTATNLSTELPALMEMASSKKFNQEAADKVLKPLADMVERAKNTPRNKDSAEMWRLLQDDIVKPFFDMWKSKGKLDADYVRLTKGQVERSLASISRAEKAKRGECTMPATNN
ncbi:MAG: hypothetical protein IT259_12260 [Saprospiraceae bacterium]|nr:hypothetical protein [Saprospiraceae bacterium]